MLIILFLVSHFNFLFVPCGGLSWLPVSFLLHVKHTLSYRSVCAKVTGCWDWLLVVVSCSDVQAGIQSGTDVTQMRCILLKLMLTMLHQSNHSFSQKQGVLLQRIVDGADIIHNNINSMGRKKTCHSIFVHNFDKHWSIFKIILLLESAVNLPRGSCHISHHTRNASRHYLVKNIISKISKFWPIYKHNIVVLPYCWQN